jgi:hypothetical protein
MPFVKGTFFFKHLKHVIKIRIYLRLVNRFICQKNWASNENIKKLYPPGQSSILTYHETSIKLSILLQIL